MILWQLNLPENPPTAADAHCRMQTVIFKTKIGSFLPLVVKKIFQMLTENRVMQRYVLKFAGGLTQWL